MMIVLLILAALVIFEYAGYPVLLWLLAAVKSRPVVKQTIYPSATVIIAAYNEASSIRDTIANKLELAYPSDKLSVIVVSDGSDDGTDDIVREFSSNRVTLLRQEPRQGKTAALNMAAAHARSDILVFADANSMYAADALERLASNFADPAVGYVTGKMVYVSRSESGVSEGCSTYMKYENMLRVIETRIGSIVGVDGGIDAVRTELYTPMDPSLLPDFVLPLNVVEQGYRVVYEPAATLKEEALDNVGGEYRMRVRVSLRAFHAMWRKRNLFNPLRYGLFSFQLLSHKLLRYWVGYLMALILLISAALAQTAWVRAFLGAQIVCYCMALGGWYLARKGRSPAVLYIPFYFCLVNVAAAEAFLRFLKGEQQIMWKPREGDMT